ncbi:MAG: glycosyltransferase family 2 protein [Prevotella sp.]|nr:glycosyltransferase family 2 protein [Prevotella sp.]MBR2776302.1 glycosyltransferase family 2 protein [Prevotella sp.]
MKEENKISVVINTYNASQHLQQVLDAVSGFDEVLVCDMESTDSTLDIARKNGCHIVTFPRGQYNIVEPAREFAIHQTLYRWVLVVDADEVVTEELKAYLYDIIQKDHCPDGLFIPRKNYFMGRFMRCHYPDHILRFFRQDKTHWPAVIHCMPEVAGRVEKIPASRKDLAFEHLANDSIENIVSKTNQYTRNELERKRNKHYGLVAFLWRPFFRFFKTYILKGAILDGRPGFIKAVLEGYYQFIFLAKKYEQSN